MNEQTMLAIAVVVFFGLLFAGQLMLWRRVNSWEEALERESKARRDSGYEFTAHKWEMCAALKALGLEKTRPTEGEWVKKV
jgi:hypothetical protein